MENRVVDTNLWFSICWVFVLTRLCVVLQASCLMDALRQRRGYWEVFDMKVFWYLGSEH